MATTRSVVTGDGGHALFADVEPGLLKLRARRVGLQPGELAASVAPGRNTVSIRMSEAVGPVLDTVRVVGNRGPTARLDEFDERYLRHEATAAFNYDDIRKVNPVDAWQMLSRVSAISLIDVGKFGGKFPTHAQPEA